ncbi:MAG: hypothetical protein ABW162_17075 [Candidatus Sedimenticola sp. PURPLELP]
MAIPPISSSTLQGIQRGFQGIRRNAAEIASARQMTAKFPTKDLVRSMVELNANSHHTTASIKAFKAADQMIGSLLDVKA